METEKKNGDVILMNEQDYIKAGNRIKVSMALTIIRDILPGEEYGISKKEHIVLKGHLRNAEVKLFDSFELKDD